MSRIVIALGGNALGNTPTEQQQMVKQAVPSLVQLIKDGHQIIVSHGNGPQVGMIDLAFDTACRTNEKIPPMPLPECAAMSQGYIGYHLQKELSEELHREGIKLHTASVITQSVVDANDPAFSSPTKPIGSFYTKEQAEALMAKDPDLKFVEDAGRGWRRVVPSPKPIDIVEKGAILSMAEKNIVVIACGGGGIPVVKEADGSLKGVAAVIDKDFASARLAELVGADVLFILTAVDRVAVNFGKPDQKFLESITASEARKLCAQGHFAPGSMLPKVEAAIEFAQFRPGNKAIIASLEKAALAVRGESGTAITV
ncbi:MAG: carbamate kinase [Oscillospiraceae bacterium]|nr:carbamate kinase [Oscillospiraceae bacterium]